VEDGLPIIRHWRPPEKLLLHRGCQEYLTHLPFSYASLARGDDDIAHAHFPTDALVATRWATRVGKPSIFTYHGNPERAVLASRRGRMRLLAEVLGESDAVVVSSRSAADGLHRWFGRDARVIYPGVRLERFTMSGQRDDRPTIACAAATGDARKRTDLLVRAFRRVLRERPRTRLLLVRPDDPEQARQLEGAGAELFSPDPDVVASVFQRAWVSALASRNEAFGLVLVEALACGTPVVGPSDGGVPEIIDRPEVGRLFTDGEVELARALLEALELAEDPRTPAICRARAGDFTTARAAREHLALYEEVTAGSTRGRVGQAA
jgi:glycosyltransferase involved in cell wall biosynthesis